MRPPTAFRGVFRTDEEARAVYSEAAGIARLEPMAVAVPVDPEDAETLVRWAAETRTALIARGSGSSMGGGAIGTGVVVDFGRLNAIGDVDREDRRVFVGPGAIREAVNEAVARQGLRFPGTDLRLTFALSLAASRNEWKLSRQVVVPLQSRPGATWRLEVTVVPLERFVQDRLLKFRADGQDLDDLA